MPRLVPIKRSDFIVRLRRFGFEGPYSGGKHQYMIQGQLKVWIPNPHQGDIGKSLLARILTQANITREEWESL